MMGVGRLLLLGLFWWYRSANVRACDEFCRFPENDGSGTPLSTPTTYSFVRALSLCLRDNKCLSVTFDKTANLTTLYDSWNEGNGGEYELKTRCPRDVNMRYIREVDLCFKVIEIRLNWADAAAHCATLGAKLAILDSPEKVGLLLQNNHPNRRYFNVYNGEIFYWVGGSYDGKDYRWENGVQLPETDRTSWHVSRPINVAVYDSLVLDVDPSSGIFDEVGAALHFFICEF